jgi:hypothetical protein
VEVRECHFERSFMLSLELKIFKAGADSDIQREVTKREDMDYFRTQIR